MATKSQTRKTPQSNSSEILRDVMPMLATLVNEPVEGPEWLYEIKWDGYRALAYKSDDVAEIKSRNNKSFNEKFYPVYDALKKWKINAVIDGEIVVLNAKGIPDFGDLQAWRSEADGELAFYLFDILWLDGTNLLDLELIKRRELLRSIIPNNSIFKLSETFDATGSEFFALADKMGLEGIMAKRANSKYVPDSRSKDWLKIKTEKRQEAVIAGYTKNEGSSKRFSALLLGLYNNGEFEFIGPVGTGFTNKLQADLLQKLKPLETNKCPFKTIPDYNKPSRFRPNPPKAEVTWVKPQVVCEISYRELTKDNAIRHPSFKGLREDKNAADVGWEKAIIVNTEVEQNTLIDKKVMSAPTTSERKTLLNPKDESQARLIVGHEIKFNNLSKAYWPKDNVTKRDMLNYYYQVAPIMLPYYKNKPQTLYRFPGGINGIKFYQKDVKGKAPSWIKTFPYTDSEGIEKEFLVVDDEASILYIASLGCIEINPWNSRIQKPDNPDWCIIDLDPDKNTFDQVIEAANVTREILSAIEVPSYPKTSGSTGLHIYIPFGAKYDYEASKEFARVIAKLIHLQLPEFTSIERKISDRSGKMYVDFLQNRPKATVAGPYSLRPKPGAPVSMPLHWEEVKKGLSILDFNIFNAMDRIKEQGDIFKNVMGKGIDLKKVMKNIDSLFGGN